MVNLPFFVPLIFLCIYRTQHNCLSMMFPTAEFKGNPDFLGILNWIIQILHYLSLLFSLLIATCCYFTFLNGRVFSVLRHSLTSKWSFALHIASFSALKISFPELSLAEYLCLHKNHTYFMSSVITERLHKSLFYKFFWTNLSQVVLRRFYTERCV